MIFILKVYIDGASRGNPGMSGIGIAVYDFQDKIILQKGYFIGQATNNQAEYSALIKALELLKDKDVSVNVYTDSELLAKQWQMLYKVKDFDLKQLYQKARDLAAGKSVKVIHIGREKNKLADKLANEAIDEQEIVSRKKEKKENIQISAGGVVYKKEGKRIKICLIAKNNGKIWTLPRGRVEQNEDPKITAEREVYEETGYKAQAKEKVYELSYYFKLKDTDILYHKFVIFYLMPLVSSKQEKRDTEADLVGWFSLDEAYRKITRLNEKEVIKAARSLLV